MIVNGPTLLALAPIKDMFQTKQRAHGVSHGLSEAGYDIRIKQDIHFYFEDGVPCIRRGNEVFKNTRFVLASAIEEFQMPYMLVGKVFDKSTWARQGVGLFNTVIEPGWLGFLTLEIEFKGSKEVRIPVGAGIAQVLFERLETPAIYTGKYQDQPDRPVSAKFQ